jgi:protein gp37
MAIRGSGPGGAYEGLVKLDVHGRPAWTGEVRLIEKHLDDPIRWTKPRMVFVNSMSDLFHESLPAEHIAEVYAVMAIANHHVFQVLTKRAARAAEILADASFIGMVSEKVRARDFHARATQMEWPLANVWHGVSVENQAAADERCPDLLRTPAALRWVSAEPLLECLEIRPHLGHEQSPDWIVVGGESGPRARPYDLAWAEEIRVACAEAGVRFFHKQAGSNPYLCGTRNPMRDAHGKDQREWPASLRVQQFPADGAKEVNRGE